MKPLTLILLSFIMVSFIGIPKDTARVKITVVNEDNLIVQGAKVTLYPSSETYKKSKGWVASGETNEKGSIEFKGLKEKVYYIHVKKGDLNNNGGAIKTDTLSLAGKNRFEIIIN